MKKHARALASAVSLGLLGLFLASCATSSGGTYSRAASSESGAARQGRVENPRPPVNRPPERRGSSAVIIVNEPRYEPKGRLAIEGLAGGATVYVDSVLRLSSRIELPIGRHDVRITRFGYYDFEATVDISLNDETRLYADLVPAGFSFEGMKAENEAFDPLDPGFLGACRIRIEAMAPGAGRISVLDASGTLVRSLGPAEFRDRRSLVAWDGRDDSGRVLDPGTYEIVAEGRGQGSEDRDSVRVEILPGRFSRSASLHGGVSGALFSPDARCLEPGGFESTTGAVFHVEPEASAMSGMGTVETGIRIGLARRPAAIELDASVMGVLWADPLADSVSWSAAIKGTSASADGRRAAGLYLRATGATFTAPGSGDAAPSWDGAARYPGLAIGAPLELAFERSRFFVSPEIEVSDYYPYWYGSSLPYSTPGLFAWGYLRAGIEASVGRSLTLVASGALRTEPFGSALGIRWPLPLGLEARWHAPEMPLTLSFAVMGEIDSPFAYYFGAGAFASFRL
jgi:hypothetical protein